MEDYSSNDSKKKICQNIRHKTAIKASLHFSHYTSMETLSCHSNQSAYATAIFVEPNAMNISAKFKLDVLILFCKLSPLVAMKTNQIERFGQKVYVW